MKNINKKELSLVYKMLELASEQFSNNVCNDVDENFYDGWALEERQNFVKEFHEWNGDPEEYDENFLNLGDSMIMSFLAHKVKSQIIMNINEIEITAEEYDNETQTFKTL